MMFNYVKYFVYLFVFSFIISCAVNPVTGKREFMLISEQEEIQLGKDYDPQIVQMYGIYEDAELKSHIDKMGADMGKLTHRSHLNYHYKIMDSPVINAFAVPGGYVYFTRGILAYLNSEAELAGVMGHELGHITARHSAKQISKSQLAQLGLGLGSIVSETFAQYAGLAAQSIGILFLKFSRDNEKEADRLGVEYSAKAGYDAKEMSNFFVTLNKMHGSGGGGLPEFLSTHPNPDGRIGAIQKNAAKWKTSLGGTQLKINRDQYLKLIDGITFGDDPRQGYVDANIFYHPDLTFQFPVPVGWNLTNLPSQVQINSADEKAAIIFTLGKKSSAAEEANTFVSESKVTVASRKDVALNGLKGIKMESTLASQQGNLKILSYFVKLKTSVFVFHGFSAPADFGNYSASFQQTMNGFRLLTNKSKMNVSPDKLRIKKLTRSMSLKQALKSYKMADEDLEKLALMNGKELTDNLRAGTQIKVIEKGR